MVGAILYCSALLVGDGFTVWSSFEARETNRKQWNDAATDIFVFREG